MNHAPSIYKLNLPPERHVSVPAERLRRFAYARRRVTWDLPDAQAGQLAELLTGNDLARGALAWDAAVGPLCGRASRGSAQSSARAAG